MESTTYVHLLGYKSDSHKLTGVPNSIQHAHLLNGGAAVEFERQDDTFILTVPAEQRDLFNTVVVLF